MATPVVKKFILIGGQSNGLAIGDAQTWEDQNERIAFRSPLYENEVLPQFSQGSYPDTFTMPQTFPGGPQEGILGDTINGQWQTFSLRGRALRFVRFLTFYNATPSFLSWDGYTNVYPGTGTLTSNCTPTRLNTNVQSQPARTPQTLASVTVADPGVFTKSPHNLETGDLIAFTSTATNGLPGGLSARNTYYVTKIDANTFNVSDWPNDTATLIEITSSGSGTINFHRAERGTITRQRTGTTHTAACGGPGGLTVTNGTYVLNVDPPFLNPPPEYGEQFDYQFKSAKTGTTTSIVLDTRLGGLHDLGNAKTDLTGWPTAIRKPGGDHPAAFTAVGAAFYEGRPVQLAPAVIANIATAVDTVTELITIGAGHTFSNGDPVKLDTTAGTIPGLVAGTTYYVISLAGNDFAVSEEVGGSAVNITGALTGFPVITAALPGPLQEATNYYVARTDDAADVELTASTSTVITASDKFDLGTDYKWLQDERVQFDGNNLPGGLVEGQTYYVQLLSATDEFQVSEEVGGTAVTLSDVGGGTVTIERLDLKTTWYLTDKPGGEEIKVVTGSGPSNPTATMQGVFNGSLTGTTIRCTSGSLVADGKRYLKHSDYDSTNDIATMHVSEAFSSAPVADDVFVIEAPDMPAALGEANESIGFKDWGLFLPACPFEGHADGTWPMNTVTFDLDDADGIKVTGIVKPVVGAVFKLYTTGRLPAPFEPGARYWIKKVDDDDNVWLHVSSPKSNTSITSAKRKGVSSVASDIVTFGSDHTFGHNEAIVFEGDDTDIATLGLTEGTTYYVNKQSSTTIKVYDAPNGSNQTLGDLTSADLTARLADSGTHYAMSVEQQGKVNPYPPGFNYPNHANIPDLYQPFSGPMRTGTQPKSGMALRLAQRISEYTGEETYVVQSAIGGSTIALREITPGNPAEQLPKMWFDFRRFLSWAPSTRGQCFDRLIDELKAAKRAAALESVQLECVGIFWPQGESDAYWEDSSTHYQQNLERVKTAIRGKIKELGLCSTSAESIPWIQPFIDEPDWQTTGKGWTFGPQVNAGITAAADVDARMRTVKESDATFISDGVHHDGTFMSIKSDRCFEAWKSLQREGVTQIAVCNMALANLGDTATITSIDPPDGSEQAAVCAQYWTLALNKALESHNWDFSTRRTSPTAITTDRTEWLYSYELPANFAGVIAVLPKDTTDDLATGGTDLRLDFAIANDGDQSRRLYCNSPDVVLRYNARVADSSQWSDSFTHYLSWVLSSMIAPPIFKGTKGIEAARMATQMLEFLGQKAMAFDSVKTRKRDVSDTDAAWDRDSR